MTEGTGAGAEPGVKEGTTGSARPASGVERRPASAAVRQPPPVPVGEQVRRALRRFQTRWPAPDGPPPTWFVPAGLVAGLFAALVLVGPSRPGLNLLLVAVVAAGPAVLAGRPGTTRSDAAFAALGVALCAVAAFRASEWLAWLCALAGLGLGLTATLHWRRAIDLVLAGPLFAVAALRAQSWLLEARPDRLSKRSRPKARELAGWAQGLAVGVPIALVVTVLLASGDADFADALSGLDFPIDTDLMPLRVLVFLLVAGIVPAAAYGLRTSIRWTAPPVLPRRPVGEWLAPLALVGFVLAAFLAVQASALFGGPVSGVHPADRARQGFWQLSAVTVIVLLLLGWTGRRATEGPRRRRAFGLLGGALAAMTLAVLASALRRLWLYEQSFGWTVTRILAGGFEIWIGCVLVGVALAWLLRRTAWLPRAVVGSAGVALLVLALAGPDARAASWNVNRFEDTGRLDVSYLAQLSADAVPALDRLPDPERSCALGDRSAQHDRWYAPNLARHRAATILGRRPAGACTGLPDLRP